MLAYDPYAGTMPKFSWVKFMRKPIEGISEESTEFLTCIILHMLVPLLPLIIESWKMKGDASEATLAITASMYSISIGLSSRNKGVFSLCLFISFLFSMAFGLSVGAPASGILPLLKISALITIVLVFIIHSCERYNIHVVECAPFWNFKRSDG
jgi:hypothetical protein